MGRRLFKKIAIIGVGLIGGSIGMAIKKNGLADEVVGLSYRQSSLTTALKNNAIDKAFNDARKAVKGADLVILATPVKIIISMLSEISKHLKPGCIVTDVGSVKKIIIDVAEKTLPASVSFVGSHPLAGSEKSGAGNASAELFNNSLCIVTPTQKTRRGAKDRVKNFWIKLGITVSFLSPDEHDRILAYISHMPHLLAYALMDSIPPEYLRYASQGLKDTTRIASSSANMWMDICMANPKNILHSLDEVVKTLSTFRKFIIAKDEKNLVDYFRKSKTKRDGLV